MKRMLIGTTAAALFLLVAGAAYANAQGTFKIPFAFKVESKNFASGEYKVALAEDGKVLLQQASTGKETLVPVLDKIAPPTPPPAEPQIVFHAVGNFAPSYTEYVTEYVLAEVWFPGQEGFLLHVTKGAHQLKTVKGEAAK